MPNFKPDQVLECMVLEVKEKTAVLKFSKKPTEAKVAPQALKDLRTGQEIKVRVKGWYNGELLLKVLKKKAKGNLGSIDIKV